MSGLQLTDADVHKEASINIDRQIFGKLAVIGQSRGINISELSQYELAPVPLSIFSLDSSLKKHRKALYLNGSRRISQFLICQYLMNQL